LQGADRYHIPVRARRAYLAGFGSSGSLLAAAAALFLVGSAIVAFGGWPQIANRPATSNVAAAAVPASAHASRRLIHALAATAPRVHARGVVVRSGVTGRTVRRNVAGRTVARGTPATPTTPGTPAAGTTTPGAATASVPAPVSGCSSCTHPGGSPGPVTTVTNKVTTVTNKVAQTVATVGGDVGQQITGLTGTVANPVSAVSPPVGGAVGAVGSTVGSTVSGTATTAANVVTTVGNVLGGGH
jgi:hypothetical protein